jgi:hypothetical protein
VAKAQYFFKAKMNGFRRKMVLLAHRLVRSTVLGLMFFLAATACCWCDSYDPDPYDDVPSVVTVEFNYVVPTRVSVRRPSAQNQNARAVYAAASARQRPVVIPELVDDHGVMACLPGPCHMVIPLRR